MLLKLLKRLFEPNPKERPSVKQAFRFIETIQSKLTSNNPRSKGKSSAFSKFDEEDKDNSDSSGDDVKKYKTAFREDEENIEENMDGKIKELDTVNRDFRGFATKVPDKFSNGTQGWVRYATDNSSFPPKIQFLSKLVLKAWKNRDKIGKFYKNLDMRGFGQNTIIALKSLTLLHKYML